MNTERETRFYFLACDELRVAKETGDTVLADLALGEIAGLWLHSRSLRLRDRCADVLERNGWAAEMERLCAA